MIKLEIEIEADRLIQRLSSIRDDKLPENRRRMIEDVTREALRRTIVRNPVDTGRSRSAWVTGLEGLGGIAPVGWKGAHPDPAAISEGSGRSSHSLRDSSQRTEIQVSNAVRYIAFLELGTRKMAPFQMVRRTLLEARNLVCRTIPEFLKGIAS